MYTEKQLIDFANTILLGRSEKEVAEPYERKVSDSELANWVILHKSTVSNEHLQNCGQNSDQSQKGYGLIVCKEFAEKHPELISGIKNIIENVITDDNKYKPFRDVKKAMDDMQNISERASLVLTESFKNINGISGSIKCSDTCEKPPVGIIPREIWEEQRINALMEAINRHLAAGRLLPEKWVDELNSLFWDRIKTEEQ